jgi:uncharacterized OB-fold protein
MTALKRPEPTPSRDSAFFWDGLREGKLLGQRCRGCGKLRHPPRPVCPDCGSLEWDAVPLSGRGRVHAWIKPVHPPLPMFEEGYLVALIELEEGIRILSNLCDVSPEDVENDMPVEVFYITLNEGEACLHQFRPSPEVSDD